MITHKNHMNCSMEKKSKRCVVNPRFMCFFLCGCRKIKIEEKKISVNGIIQRKFGFDFIFWGEQGQNS